MNWDISQFHFIRPLWLLAIPIAIMLWLLMSRALKTTYWEAHLNKQILEALRVNTSKQSSIGRWLLLFGWVTACLAAAGPTWQKQPVPSFQNNSAMVIVFDLSVSMLAKDLAPNRLAQAKYKLIDILRTRSDGQTALIVYSGDAHTVTPLTDDPNAIELLLPALHPNIMPIKGSNTEAAIELATQLLSDTGNNSGDILLITDGVAKSAQANIERSLTNAYSLSILGIGSNEASPIPLEDGGFLRSASGEIILSTLENQQLSQLAAKTNGRYSQIQINDSDINYLVSNDFDVGQDNFQANSGSTTAYDNWVDMGHWLVLLLLPLTALCFRKGVIYLLPLCLILPPDANAFEWQDLWLNKDQQAQKLLKDDPQAAAETFERDDWSGVANYEAKNYQAAADKFLKGKSASDHYNRGNALALAGKLDEALQAYDKALDIEPELEDAAHNKNIIEKIKDQQQEQQNQQGQDGEQSEQDSEQSEQNSENSEGAEGSNEQDAEGSEEQDAEGSEEQDAEGSEEQSSGESEEQNQQQSEEQTNSQASNEEAGNEEAGTDEASNEEESTDDQQVDETNQTEEEQAIDEESRAAMLGEATPEQLQDSSEQWLRGIQNDPSGLLRRKFEYQSWQRSQQQKSPQINSGDERY